MDEFATVASMIDRLPKREKLFAIYYLMPYLEEWAEEDVELLKKPETISEYAIKELAKEHIRASRSIREVLSYELF